MRWKHASVTIMIIFSCLTTGASYLFGNKAPTKTDNTPTVQVPVLCYHNIRERKKGNDASLTISPQEFLSQLSLLYDSGYRTLTVDELMDYIQKRQRPPVKSMLITFDDGHAEHFDVVMPTLKKYGFKGIFFINTICLNKKNYLGDAQVKQLSLNGNTIGAHTRDHPNLVSAANVNWKKQLLLPKQQLEHITGKTVDVFAYPYGCWNRSVIDSLKYYGYKAAFQLNGKQDILQPLFTMRRIMCSGAWTPEKLQQVMHKQFD